MQAGAINDDEIKTAILFPDAFALQRADPCVHSNW